MEHSFRRNAISFLLVFALTVLVVAGLSRATTAGADAAPARYSQQVRESRAQPVTELSASIAETADSPLKSMGAFGLILIISGAGLAGYLRSRRKGKEASVRCGRRYSPRADMTFRSTGAARTRV